MAINTTTGTVWHTVLPTALLGDLMLVRDERPLRAWSDDRLRRPGPTAARWRHAAGGRSGRRPQPLPIVVPCHRVIGATGKLVGSAGGTERKRTLLELEQPILMSAAGLPAVGRPATGLPATG